MRLRYRIVSVDAGRTVLDQVQHMQHMMNHQIGMLGRVTPGSTGAWQPPTDVYETDDVLVVRVELAGVREEDIDITLFADHLTITAVRHNNDAPSAAYRMAGILYGEFRLAVPVVTNIKRDDVEATHENGLLTITLPKSVEHITPKSIQPSAISR